jgi:hypothetical protein
MTRVLFVGYEPETVDFSDPALPPGITAERIHAGIAVAMKGFAERGWEADLSLIRPNETAVPTIERLLASKTYDCVVIGAGVRLPPRGLALFEAIINTVHNAAPGAAIAFNTRPEDAQMLLPVGWGLEAGLSSPVPTNQPVESQSRGSAFAKGTRAKRSDQETKVPE